MRAPGAQRPDLYPTQPGQKYLYWGEQQGWVYDPYNDTYLPDPKQSTQYYEDRGLVEKEPEPPGLGEQLAPVAGVVGAGYAAKKIGEGITEGGIGKIPENIGTAYDDFVGFFTPDKQAPQASTTLAQTGTDAGSALAGQSTAAAPTNPGLMSIEPANPYQLADGSIVEGSTGATETAPGMFDLSGVGQAGNLLLPTAGAYGFYDLYANDRFGDTRGVAQGAASGAAMGSYFGPWGTAIGGVVGGAFGAFGGGHKGTDQYRAERWGNAREKAATDADRQAVEHFYQIAEAGAKNQTFEAGPLAGREWNWEDIKGLGKGEDIWGANAFFDAFPDWISGFSEDQRRQIAQAALDQNLLASDNGSIVPRDKAALQQVAAQVKSGEYVPIISEEEREKGRQEYAASIGVDYTPLSLTAASQGISVAGSAGGVGSVESATTGQKPGMMAPAANDARARIASRYGDAVAANYNPEGGVGGPGYKPDPNRPGHFIRS